MSTKRPILLLVAAALFALAPSKSSAQTPIEAGAGVPPLVLVLLDTSGSMEWIDEGGSNDFPICVADDSSLSGSGTSRMHAAIEVLTGRVVDRYCAADFRDGTPSRLDQVDPTRPQGIRHSRLCSRLGVLTNHVADCVPEDPYVAFGGLPQLTNGLLDEFSDEIAFGFMAFDSFPEPSSCPDGMWSYGPSLRMSGSGMTPSPPSSPESMPSCTALSSDCWNLGARAPYVPEVGAPNCILPPPLDVPQGWSVPPLDPSGTRTQAQLNAEVQAQILRLVPYWSTPLGAMLADALHFYTGAPDYFAYKGDVDGADYSHGIADPYLECRRRFVLLVTDGIPSFSACVRVGTNGPETTAWDEGCEHYPYADAPYYAAKLREAGIPVYVVGFSLANDPNAEAVLDAIAVAGGTGEARFAQSGLSLVFELGDIFSAIVAASPSRTTPANTTSLAADDERGQYTFETHFEIHGGSPYWTGEVKRIERVCESGTLGAPQEIVFSEWYDDLTMNDMEDHPILTTSPRWHSCYLRNAGDDDASLFSGTFNPNPLTESYGVTDLEVAAACQVDAVPGASTTASDACKDLNDGAIGLDNVISGGTLDSRCLVEIDPTVAAAHYDVFGAADGAFADLFTKWLRGWTLTELRLFAGYGSQIEQLLPTSEPRWDGFAQRYTFDRQSRLASVVHSSPTVVTRPDPRLEISVGYSLFVEDTEERPAVLYTATTDGLLRALDASTTEEIFAFLPSSIAHRIGDTIQTHRALIDGSPVVEDIRVNRSATGGETWMTALLLPYRGAGRGVTALDVTDPYEPAFLWELDAELDPQLGLTYSRPAMGAVYMAECLTDSTIACERGVAIFGGGAPPSGLQDWSGSNIGRTMYVVDIATGRVIRRFTHARQPDGTMDPISAPVIGEVAAFDGFAGSLITRAFVGTLDGKLLRLDLSSSDPADWIIDVIFDPSEAPVDDDAVGGIFFRPTIALSRQGSRAVILFGTGNLDDLDQLLNETNYIVSITEKPIFNADGEVIRYGADLNWALELEDRERLTARPRIFDRRAYFATFMPSEDVCEIGGARLYALDFIGLPENAGYVGPLNLTKLSSYLKEDPYDQIDPNPTVGFHDASTYAGLDPVIIPPQSIIYSLNITERVSCFVEEELAGTRGGQSVSRTVTDQGEYVLQIGTSSYVGTSEGETPQAMSQLSEIALERPASAVIPTSWSVIFE